MKVNFKIALDFQLGHLYEHIFINQFTKRLREADFLAFLDYEIYGETHSNGLIVIYIQAFSENCAEFINDNFDNFSLDFSEEEVAAAAIQIFAEKQMVSDGFNDGYLEELNKLEKQNWRKFNKNEFEDEESKTFDNWLNLRESEDFRKTKIVISGDKNIQREVFFFISKIIVNNLSEDIERELFCFTLGVNEYEDAKLCSEIIFRKSSLQEEDFNYEDEIIQAIIDKIKLRMPDVREQLKTDGILVPEQDFNEIINKLTIDYRTL